MLRALPSLADKDGTALLLLHNFHRFLNNPEVVQTTFAQLVAGKQQRTFLVVLSPVVQIPVELEKLFVVLEHALPDREQLERIARELTSDSPDDLPQGEDLQRVLDAAAGLTRYEAEGAFALSLTRHNAIRPESIWELKAQTLKKNNLLTLHRGRERFDSLGGLANLKDFCRRALRPGKPVKPRGVLLAGRCRAPARAAFAKALGNETGRPTLLLDLGALMGSLVGQTEANLRQALRIADAMSPCVLFVDELEKALSGVGGQGDSGVSTRLFGTLLTWLSDHTSDVFFVGTSNDISKLPPEFARAERFDGVFFLDLPSGAREGPDLGDVSQPVRHSREPGPARRHLLDRRRDPFLLPAGGAAGRHPDPGRPPRRAGGRHRGRAGGEAAHLGQRPLPVGLGTGHLPPRWRGMLQAGPPRPARSEQQLTAYPPFTGLRPFPSLLPDQPLYPQP